MLLTFVMTPDNNNLSDGQRKGIRPSYLPRPGDLPRKELVAEADRVIAEAGGPSKCLVYFKFTCMWCGERCILVEPNTLYEIGECQKCGKKTKIDVGGLQVHYKVKK